MKSKLFINYHFSTSKILKKIALAITVFGLSQLAWAEGKSTLADFSPEIEPKFQTLLDSFQASDGEIVFMRKCSSCHDHEKDGGHGKGPHLWNLLGRKAGAIPGFEFSPAMRGSGHIWTEATLNYYLTNTEIAVPGRSMNFRGIRRDKVRAKLIAFLRSLQD